MLLMGCALVLGGCDDSRPAGPRALSAVTRPEPMRRLSHAEYRNSLRDLLGIDLAPPELPADTARDGLENDARALGASELLLRRYEETARTWSAAAVADDGRLASLMGCPQPTTPSEIESCGHTFVTRFGLRAFRRPLVDDEVARFESLFRNWAAEIDVRAAAELTIATLLQSPSFLYRIERAPVSSEGAPPDDAPMAVSSYEMASRLSYALWQSMPDAALLEAASEGGLESSEAIDAQARRMLEDPRTRGMLVDFHRQWLDLDRIFIPEHLTRAGDPDWDAATIAASHEEALRFIRLALSEGTFDALFNSRRAQVNERLATLYGVPFEGEPGSWVDVELPEGERAGILTRIAVLASHAHPGYASPPLRGNFVLSHVTCAAFDPPPASADLTQPVPEEGEGPRTNRELFAARTASPGCQSCHRRLDGVGFGLESYDARGVFRSMEVGRAIDASGRLVGLDVVGDYDGGVELSALLARSTTVERCYTRRFMEMVWGRPLTGNDEATLRRVHARFSGSGGRIDALLMAIVTDPTFRQRTPLSE
jgi:hypothetical protein